MKDVKIFASCHNHSCFSDAEYTPEQLIGRKIIVIANLKPNRICNVNSQGMLLAATNNACGCKIIFVDDSVPEGTAIH